MIMPTTDISDLLTRERSTGTRKRVKAGCACQDQSVQPLSDYGPLGRLLSTPRPGRLYHYTGPAGAIGILKTRTLWAGRAAEMNDSTEQQLAHDHARQVLGQLSYPVKSFGEGMVQYALERLARPGRRRFEGSRAYTVSLTSDEHSLEQWRAYYPRSGGVALGFSSQHLQDVGTDQRLLLVPCVYDDESHRAIVKQIVHHHLENWNRRQPLETRREGISSHLVRDFVSDLERFAPLLKHSSFAAEREWRLISPSVGDSDSVEYIQVPTETGIKLFQVFALLTPQHPVISDREPELTDGLWRPSDQGFIAVVGPNTDPWGMAEAIRALTPPEFGWAWNARHTESPYR